ncbi:hypothetical protein GQ42DRAFT_122559, partial [Ramicandelaber brevisporus]
LQHLPDLYRSTSKVVRNGAGFVGTDSLRTYLSSLPPTTHIVTSYNCHPLPVTTISPQAQPNEQHSLPSSLITVTGTVKFGGEGFERPFTQTFIINPDLNPTQEQQEKLGDVQLFYIGSDTLRIHDQ